jgi:adenylate kinase
MRLVFLGAPGVGKGTQAEMMAAKLAISKISTGDLLRTGVAQKTSLGLEAQQYMTRGELVPDNVVIGLVAEKIGSPECEKGFILDGFPRTILQADALSGILQKQEAVLDRVMYFVIPREEVVRRLSGRRSCSTCSAVYHIDYVPPKQEGRCDECGAALVQRSDDKRETVESRLMVYEEQTSPLIDYYKEKDVLAELDGTGSVEDVQGRLLALLAKS